MGRRRRSHRRRTNPGGVACADPCRSEPEGHSIDRKRSGGGLPVPAFHPDGGIRGGFFQAAHAGGDPGISDSGGRDEVRPGGGPGGGARSGCCLPEGNGPRRPADGRHVSSGTLYSRPGFLPGRRRGRSRAGPLQGVPSRPGEGSEGGCETPGLRRVPPHRRSASGADPGDDGHPGRPETGRPDRSLFPVDQRFRRDDGGSLDLGLDPGGGNEAGDR